MGIMLELLEGHPQKDLLALTGGPYGAPINVVKLARLELLPGVHAILRAREKCQNLIDVPDASGTGSQESNS